MDIALDLGTSRFRVGVLGHEQIWSEPATVSVDEQGTCRAGVFAEQLVGRAPRGVSVVHPIDGGVVKEFDAAVQLIRYALSLVEGGKLSRRSNVTVSVPTGLTAVERRAVEEAVRAAGAKQVRLFETVIAAAIGAGLPVAAPRGTLVLNLGAGVTEAAVVSLGGIVDARKAAVGGRNLDRAIAEAVRREYGFLIGIKTAEQLKCAAGASADTKDFEVRGRNLGNGLPESLLVPRALVASQVESYSDAIVSLLVDTLESAPPELVGDFMECGIVVSGAGAQLSGLMERLRRATEMPIQVAEDAENCVIRGLLTSHTRRRNRPVSATESAKRPSPYRRLAAGVQNLLARE
ncbi:MAG: rod shape-determining protein [Alicyclobacillus sp.]|nr:rod shape-determining protein [Alicyclobacillus sp.]